MATTYKQGQRVRLTGTFKDDAGALGNPTTLTLKVRDGDGTITTYNNADLTNTSVGVWIRDITLTQAGNWKYWFASTLGIITADGDEFTVTVALV